MSEWAEAPLETFLERITYGFTNPMPTVSAGPYMITAKDINHGRILYEQARSTSEKAFEALLTDKSRLNVGDVLVTKDGTLGRIAIVDRERTCINQSVALLQLKSSIRSRFLKYLLEEPRNFAKMLGEADGSTIKHIYITRLAKQRVRVPPLVVQDRILATLGALDDKIDLNRRMNETLEAMTRAIFKDWFIDFGPTRAKMEARASYLAPDVWGLFPDRMEDEGKPEGWRVGTLGEIARSKGQSVKPNELSADTPYIGLEHMPRRSLTLDSWEDADKVTSGKLAFRQGDILFGKLRPYFHKVGIAPLDGICSTDIVVMAAKEPSASAFVLCCGSSDQFVNYTDLTSGGTKMPRTSWEAMERYGLCLPPIKLMQAFENTVRAFFGKIVSSIHETRTLAATRDLLLPKLMFGEIRVKDAEKIAEAAL